MNTKPFNVIHLITVYNWHNTSKLLDDNAQTICEIRKDYFIHARVCVCVCAL